VAHGYLRARSVRAGWPNALTARIHSFESDPERNVRYCREECVNSRASRSIFGAECACRRAAEDLAVMGARRRVIFCRSFYRPGRAKMSAMRYER
jgi:hypothetical protein